MSKSLEERRETAWVLFTWAEGFGELAKYYSIGFTDDGTRELRERGGMVIGGMRKDGTYFCNIDVPHYGYPPTPRRGDRKEFDPNE